VANLKGPGFFPRIAQRGVLGKSHPNVNKHETKN